MSKEERTKVPIPVPMYKVMEHYAKKDGKNVDEFFGEAILKCLEEAKANPKKFFDYLEKLRKKAKAKGLTVVEYVDWEFEEICKKLSL